MKKIIAILMLFAAPAFAEDAKPAPKPTCGATVEECQRVIDAGLVAQQKKINVYKELLSEANARFVEQASR